MNNPYTFQTAFANLLTQVSSAGEAFTALNTDALQLGKIFQQAYNANLSRAQIEEALAKATEKRWAVEEKAAEAAQKRADADAKATERQENLDSFYTAFEELRDTVSNSGETFGDLGVEVLEMASVFNKAINSGLTVPDAFDAMRTAAEKTADAEEKKAQAGNKQSVLDSFYDAFDELKERVSKNGTAFGELNVDTLKMASVFRQAVNAGLEWDDAIGAMQRAAQEALDKPAASTGGGLESLAGVKAGFDMVSDTLRGFVSSVQGYAAALSPTTVAWFNTSLNNLNATLGQAVLPIFSLLTSTVERFAGVISPIAQSLAPVFASLTSAFSTVALTVTRTFAGLVEGLLPVIQVFASIVSLFVSLIQPAFQILGQLASMVASYFGAMVTITAAILTPFAALLNIMQEIISVALIPFTFAFQVLTLALLPVTMAFEMLHEVMDSFHDITRTIQIVFTTLYEVIKDVALALISWASAFLGIRSIIDTVKKAFQDAAIAIVVFAAQAALAFGNMAFVNKLIENLSKEGHERGALAAPTNAAIKDFEQISKDMATAAFTAGPGGPGATDSDLFKRMVEQLEAIKNQPPIDLTDVITTATDKVLASLMKLLSDTFDPNLLGDKIAKAIKDALPRRPF